MSRLLFDSRQIRPFTREQWLSIPFCSLTLCTLAENNGCAQQPAAGTTSPRTRRRTLRETRRIAYRWSCTRRRTTPTAPAWTSTRRRYKDVSSHLSAYPNSRAVQGSSGQRDSSNDVFLSVRSSPECKGLMAPATDLGAEWKKRFDATGASGDASLPLLRGLSPTPTTGQHNSPFFKRKKYVYPITLVGRGESSV